MTQYFPSLWRPILHLIFTFPPSRTPSRVQWEGDLPSDSHSHGSLYAFHFSLRLPLTAVGKTRRRQSTLHLLIPFSGKTAAVPEGGRTMIVLDSNITNRNTTLGGRTRAPSQRREHEASIFKRVMGPANADECYERHCTGG